MSLVVRHVLPRIREALTDTRIVVVQGAPQVGKTTLVDLILESPDGRVAGLEVKATSRPAAKDFKGLAALRDKLGKRFVGGVLLHTGPTAVPMGERISAIPLDVLWQT